MKPKQPHEEQETLTKKPPAGVSKLKLALGAAGLFLFIVGVKRSFRAEETLPDEGEEEERGERGRQAG